MSVKDNITDFIGAAANEKPVAAYNAFSAAVEDKVQGLLDQKQDEIRASMFATEETEIELVEAKAPAMSFQVDIEKVKRAAPVKGIKSLKSNINKELDKKFKAKLGDYELEAIQKNRSTIVDVKIMTDQKLSNRDKTDIENHLVDKNLKLY